MDKIIFTKEQKEILNGAMLGDGCLYLHPNGKNAQFKYLSKSRQHVEYVFQYFNKYLSGEGIKDSSYIDKRTNKEYHRTTAKTYVNKAFTEEYYK